MADGSKGHAGREPGWGDNDCLFLYDLCYHCDVRLSVYPWSPLPPRSVWLLKLIEANIFVFVSQLLDTHESLFQASFVMKALEKEPTKLIWYVGDGLL